MVVFWLIFCVPIYIRYTALIRYLRWSLNSHMQLFNVGWYLLQFTRSQNYTLKEKSTSNMHCQNTKHIYLYTQLLNTGRASNLNCNAVQHGSNKSHFKELWTQSSLFFFWEDEDVHRANCDLHIKFKNECKVSLLFPCLVKIEMYVLGGRNTTPPGILHFVWRIWMRAFQIIRNWDWCLYKSCTYVKTTITGNCGCLLLHILILNIITLQFINWTTLKWRRKKDPCAQYKLIKFSAINSQRWLMQKIRVNMVKYH